MEKFSGVTIFILEGDFTASHNRGTLPTDWRNGLSQYAVIQGGNVSMKHVCGGGAKFKLVTFTVKIRCHKDMDVAEQLYSTSIDLADAILKFELKGITCAHNETDLMALMTYSAIGKEYTETILNQTLNKAYQKHVLSLTV